MQQKKLSRSRSLGAKLVFTALTVLSENDGQMKGREAVAEVEKRLPLDDWAKERYETTGYIRWQSILHFHTVPIMKAGFLVKKSGVWFLTPEGEEALKLGELDLYHSGQEAYRKWKEQKQLDDEIDTTDPSDDGNDGDDTGGQINVEEIQQLAMEQIENFIHKLNPYEFQDLVAALLRAMGYHTPFVAPKGKDGGVDVVAYQDPLGVKSPRMKVQVKHREKTSASVDEIRQLMGLLQSGDDIGIFVSSGGFTSDSKATVRNSNAHVELIDLPRLISLWQEFYHELSDEDKNILPLVSIQVLEPQK